MDKINLFVGTLLIAALLVPTVSITAISSSSNSTGNTSATETSLHLPSSSSSNSSFLPSASLMNETSSNNNSFVYASPTVQFKTLLSGVDRSCYKVPLDMLVHRPAALCYGLQVNQLLKHPANETQRDQLLKHPFTKNLAYAANFTKYFDQKFTPELSLKSHTQQVQELFGNFSTAQKTGTSTDKCNPSLWNFMALPGPPRFIMLNPCVTVTGNVSVVRFPADGDAVIALSLDKPYSNMVTIGNFNDKMKGGIWVELICQRPMNLTTVEPFKIGSCNGYNGPIFTLPKVGDHLKVTGTYILDVREGGHAEIHPTSSLARK
jgi:hypothetical protein